MSLNDVPVEILDIVLNYLPLAQRIRCRLVDKRWLFVVDNSNPKCLVLSTAEPIGPTLWPITNEPVQMHNLLVKASFLTCFEALFGMRMFSNLEKLYCSPFVIMTPSIAEKCLNRLTKLKALRVEIFNVELKSPPCRLSLPNLQLLVIHWEALCYDLILDTPNLNQIQSGDDMRRVILLYPEKLTSVLAFTLGSDLGGRVYNLQTANLSFLNDIYDCALFCLKNLKELHFTACKEFESLKFVSRQQLLTFVDKAKNFSSSKDLEFVYGGFRLNAKLKDCRYLSQSYHELIETSSESPLSNYLDSLDNLTDTMPAESLYFKEASFNGLANRIPAGFIQKFVSLKSLAFEGSIDHEQQLIQLLNECKYVNKLQLINCSLTDQFYSNVLTVKLPFLTILKIKEETPFIDLDFLLQFALLQQADVGRLTDVDLVKKAFKHLKYLKLFSFDLVKSENMLTQYVASKERRGFINKKTYLEIKHFESIDELFSHC